MDEQGHGAGHVLPLEWSQRTAIGEMQGNTPLKISSLAWTDEPPLTITQRIADQEQHCIYVVFIIMLCGVNLYVW